MGCTSGFRKILQPKFRNQLFCKNDDSNAADKASQQWLQLVYVERGRTGEPMISTNPKRNIPAKKVIRAAKKVINEAMSDDFPICGWSPSLPIF